MNAGAIARFEGNDRAGWESFRFGFAAPDMSSGRLSTVREPIHLSGRPGPWAINTCYVERHNTRAVQEARLGCLTSTYPPAGVFRVPAEWDTVRGWHE